MAAQNGDDLANGESTAHRKLRLAMLKVSTRYRRVAIVKRFLRKERITDGDVKCITKILLMADYWLSNVIELQDARLTKAFLIEKDAVTSENAGPETTLGGVEDPAIDVDMRASVDQVLSSLDMPNAEVIFKYGPDRNARRKYFFDSLVKMAMIGVELKKLKAFVKKLADWQFLDDAGCQVIEREVFRKACSKSIRIFLECRVHVRMEKTLKWNALTTIFGNPNVSIGFLRELEFEVNARGHNGFTALHYAVQSDLVDKAHFLLDCGANPNALNSSNETPLTLTLRETQLKLAELLLQHGADPFLKNRDGRSFSSCLDSKDASHKQLKKLAVAYVRIYKSTANSIHAGNNDLLIGTETTIRNDKDLCKFYMRCEGQIRSLKLDCIRGDLTMFTVISNTGDKLIRLIDEEDRRMISRFIDKYVNEGTLHPIYLKALQEHMRRFRVLLTLQTRVMLEESGRDERPVWGRRILDEARSYQSAEKLLMFQYESENARSGRRLFGRPLFIAREL